MVHHFPPLPEKLFSHIVRYRGNTHNFEFTLDAQQVECDWNSWKSGRNDLDCFAGFLCGVNERRLPTVNRRGGRSLIPHPSFVVAPLGRWRS